MHHKQLFSRLLAFILALALLPLSLASAAAPGETVNIPIPFSVNGFIEVTQVRVSFSLTEGLSFNRQNGGTHEVILPVSPPVTGGTVYLPIQVNANAPGMGSQTLSITQVVAGDDSGFDTGGNPATHTIEISEHVHDFGPWKITQMPSYAAPGQEQRVCSLDESHVESRELPPLTDSQFGPWTTVKEASYEAPGLQERIWNYDGIYKETRDIPVRQIIWGEWKVVTAATYATKGLERRVNTLEENKFEEREIPVKEIIWGAWQVVTPATYETKGLERRVNTLDENKSEEREIPVKEIIWGEWQVITPATYETKGLERRVNTLDEAKLEDREIPVKEIIWGEWKVVTPATYESKGLERRVNTLDVAKFEERDIPVKKIVWDEWKVVVPASCTEEGLEERVASDDANLKETRALPMVPHQPNSTWFVSRLPTYETEGMKILRCKVGGEILKSEKIPAQTLPSWSRGSLRVTDASGTGSVPKISLAKEGSRVLILTDQAGTIMGKLVVMVQKGQVTFSYEIFPPFTAAGGNVSLSDPQQGAMVLPLNETFSIARDLGGWTSFTLHVDLQAENPEALAKLTSPTPTMPPMAYMAIMPTPSTVAGSLDSGIESDDVNMDELLAYLQLMEKVVKARNDADTQAKVQDLMEKTENTLVQSASMDEAAKKRFIDAIMQSARQVTASMPRPTTTVIDPSSAAGED